MYFCSDLFTKPFIDFIPINYGVSLLFSAILYDY